MSKLFLQDIGKAVDAVLTTDSEPARLGAVAVGLENGTASIAALADVHSDFEKHLAVIAGLEMNTAQAAAASFAVGIAMDPTQASGSVAMQADAIVPVSTQGIMDSSSVHVGIESFDGNNLSAALRYTVAGAIAGAKADRASELVFPTVTIDPKEQGIVIETEILKVYNGIDRDRKTTTGDGGKFKKISLIKAMRDVSVLGGDRNVLVPHFDTAGSAEHKALFVEAFAGTDIRKGVSIATAPLAVGATIPLISISQTDAQLAQRTGDQTDTLESAIQLRTLIVDLKGAGDPADIVKIDVTAAGAYFTPTYDGHNKDVILGFNSTYLTVGENTPNIANAPLADLVGGKTVTFDISVYGNGNVEAGDIVVDAGKITANSSRTNGVLDAVTNAAFADATVIGYEVESRLTNSNVADLGLIGSVEVYSRGYFVPARPALTIQKPNVNAYDTDNDANKLTTAINIANVRSKIAAYETLDRFFTSAQNILGQGGNLDNFSERMPSAAYVDAVVIDKTAVLANILDSSRSGEREEDIAGAICGIVVEMVDTLVADSNFGEAHDALNGGENIVVNIIGGAKPVRYASKLDLGVGYTVNFGTWNIADVADTLYVTLGTVNPVKGKKVDALQMGFRAYAPTVFANVQRGNNTSVSVMHNVPRYNHVIQVPVGGRLKVTGLKTVHDARNIPVARV